VRLPSLAVPAAAKNLDREYSEIDIRILFDISAGICGREPE
jgi:hypothetical protein